MAAIPGSVRVGGFVGTTDTTDTYGVTDPSLARGSLRSVPNIAARNAITKDRRSGLDGNQLGMEVVTIDTMNKYRLVNEPGTAGTTDTDWELMETGDLWDSDGTDLTPHTAENVILTTDKRYSFEQPLNCTFYATYSSSIDGDYGLGNLTGTSVGGAAISGGKLDLAHNDNRYIWHSAVNNADSAQIGAFKFKIVPIYSGNPATISPILSVGKTLGTNINSIELWHAIDGTIRLSIYDWDETVILDNVSLGIWNPTALIEYEFELNYDLTIGATQLFIIGIQLGSTQIATGIRSSAPILLLLVGQLISNPTYLSKIYVKDLMVFNAVQHTANYTPGYTLQNVKLSKSDSAVNNLQVYGDITLSKSPVINGILQTDTNGNVSSSIELPDTTTTTTPLTTFNKTIRESIDELNAFPNKINKDISYFCTATPTQTLLTSGAGDLATKIATLVDGDILEIQTNASYSAITIPAGKSFAIRVKKGYDVELNSAQAITLLNGAANVFLAGFIFDSNPSGGNDKGSAICFEHQAIVSDITFYHCTFRNNNGSAVMLSYHQTIGGDFYYTAPLLSEFSSRIAFIECNFDRAASDATEGGALSMRGISIPYIANCNINARGISRGIQLQDCLHCLVSGNKVLNAGGGGNGEGIKLDQLGTPTYYNNGVFYRNIIDSCIEGLDIDDTDEAVVQENIVSNCSNEGIVLDDSSKGVFIGNITYNNQDGIRLELGSVANLKCNVSFNNTNNNYLMDNSYVPDNSNTTSIPDTFIGADKIPYDNTTSGLTATLTNDAIDELKTLIAADVIADIFAGKSLYVKQFGSDKAETHYPAGTTGTGFINVAADFPAGWGGVTQGDCWTVPTGVTVTDNDPTKTNTGQTFIGPVQIAADKTNTRWIERDGLTAETCVSSVATALYLTTLYSTYPDYYPILVLDAATYTFGAGDAIYASINAPFAKFVSLGTILQYAKRVTVDTLIMDVGSYTARESGDTRVEFNCRYAAFGATPSAVGIFVNVAAAPFILKAGVVNGGSSTVQTIAAQAHPICAEIGLFTGKAVVTSGGGTIDITTTDRATLTTDPALGHVQVTINTADLTTVNASITAANTRITSVQQDVGQLPSGGDQLYFGNSIIQSTGSENENYLINAYTYAPGNSEGTATITVSSGISPFLYAAFLINSDMLWMAGIGRGITAAKIWASTNTSSGTTTLAFNVRVKKSYAGTVTITGTGTTRTVDSTVDAFDGNDPNAGAKKLASYLETPKGRYQIIAKTTTKQVYITVPSGYVNESAVAFSKYKYLYELYSEALPYGTVSPLVSFSTAKAEFSPSNDWAWGDKLAVFVFAATTVSSSITITWKFDGTTNYSCIQFPKFLRVKTVTDQILLTSDDSNIPNIALDATSGSADADLNWRVPMDSALVVGADIPYWVGTGATGATQDIDLTTYYGVGNGSAINQYTHADAASTYNIAAVDTNYRISFLSLIPEAVADTRGSVNLEANTLGGYIHLGAPIITYIEK